MAEDLRRLVGARIRELRKEQGLTQEELGEAADMDFRSIGGVERGERNVTLDTLARIVKALDVPPHHLLQSPLSTTTRRQTAATTPKEQMLAELTRTLNRRSDNDVRLALEVVKTLVRAKSGKRTAQKEKGGRKPT